MISFKEYTADDFMNRTDEVLRDFPELIGKHVEDIFVSIGMLYDNQEIEFAATYAHKCLLIREFDMGRYAFVYPLPMLDGSDEDAAINELRMYAVKEEIPLRITDIDVNDIGMAAANFRHVNLDSAERYCLMYTLRALNELDLIDDMPSAEGERIKLMPIDPQDEKKYALLCRDRDVNKYWGYDYLSDVGEVDDSFFLSEAVAEYNRCTALTLGVYHDGELIGDAVFHSFDLRGGCDVAFRLMTKWQGRGLGGELIECISDAARSIGLVYLTARVMKENVRSVALLERYMEHVEDDGDCKIYEKELLKL